ncbi:TIR domain-containing protein [Paenibacillus sp. AK121]|nr:TIR domain-containing protein [Paenibacillus sp. AK121]QOH62365.1 hypothetical protein DI243_13640 [Paenibacillus polymyxa]
MNEAQADGQLTWKNYSVLEHDPAIDPNTTVGKKKLQEILDNQIKPASKIIILAGMYAAHSDWIIHETNTSVLQKKYIVGVKPKCPSYGCKLRFA